MPFSIPSVQQLSPPIVASAAWNRTLLCTSPDLLNLPYASGFRRNTTMSSSAPVVPQQAEILCPKCGSPVPLTEALARPLIEATKADYERRLRAQNEVVARQQEELVKRESAAVET